MEQILFCRWYFKRPKSWSIQFLHYFLRFCFFKCRIWSLVRCSLRIFFGFAGGRPRRSNYEFVLEGIRFPLSECGSVKTCMLDVSNKWIIFMLSFRAVFITEFCFGWLPLMAAMKKIVLLLLILFDLNQSQGTKPHIPKWLWPGLPTIATGAKNWSWNEKDSAQKTWLLLDQNS